MKSLADRGIGSRPFFWPMHLQLVFKQMGLFVDEQHAIAERIACYGLYLPSGAGTTLDQVRTVAKTVVELFS